MLRARCRDHRDLFVIANATPEERLLLEFGGRASVVFTIGAPARDRAGVEEITAAFLVARRNEANCAALMGDAVVRMAECLDADFEMGLRLGWAVVSVLRAGERFVEAVEVLHSMEQAARRTGDELPLKRIERELSWLCDSSAAGGAILSLSLIHI